MDGDGLLDGFEVANGFDPEDPDEDNNGFVDGTAGIYSTGALDECNLRMLHESLVTPFAGTADELPYLQIGLQREPYLQ